MGVSNWIYSIFESGIMIQRDFLIVSMVYGYLVAHPAHPT